MGFPNWEMTKKEIVPLFNWIVYSFKTDKFIHRFCK